MSPGVGDAGARLVAGRTVRGIPTGVTARVPVPRVPNAELARVVPERPGAAGFTVFPGAETAAFGDGSWAVGHGQSLLRPGRGWCPAYALPCGGSM